MPSLLKISIIIPVFNEELYLAELLKRVFAVDLKQIGFTREVIVVDDGSTDRTAEIASSFPGVIVVRQKFNQGRGRAVLRGIQISTGDYLLMQDGDLEYDPQDYLTLLQAITAEQGQTCIYGSRFKGQLRKGIWKRMSLPGKHPRQGFGSWFAGILLSTLTLLLYGQWITDTLTSYKLYPADVLRTMEIQTSGFETEHEIMSKLIQRGIAIKEVPISYNPRTVQEGKKIRAKDGIRAVATLLRFRFQSGRSSYSF